MSSFSSLPTVVITGADRGIGRSIAIALSQTHQYKLAILAKNLNGLKETQEICERLTKFARASYSGDSYGSISDTEIMVFKCDMSDEKRLGDCIDKIGKEFGPLSCLINDAGIVTKDQIDASAMNMGNIDKTLGLNLNSLIKCTAFCVPFLKETKRKYKHNKCCVLNIGSGSGTLRAIGKEMAVYCASKWGLLGFTECLFEELRDHGIKVCSISPGHVRTPLVEHRKDLIQENMIRPSDIAKAVIFVLDCEDSVCPLEMHLRPLKRTKL